MFKFVEKSSCCRPKDNSKKECPKCLNKAKSVLSKTLNNLLIDDTKDNLPSLEGFYFCKTSSCEAIYFNEDIILTQSNLNVVVGLKDNATINTTCYCFGWTKEKIKEQLNSFGKCNVLEDIKSKMNTSGCLCESLNPSGRCCLGDNRKVLKELIKEKL